MKFLFYATLVLQGGFMAVDEFYFHFRRELPKWERLGHPLDTFFYILALFIIWSNGLSSLAIAAAVVSTLLITKDEIVHAKTCSGGEQWLHAILFILHPICLIFAFLSVGEWSLYILSVLILFLVYQIYYWNIYDHRNPIRN
jgi:hypothetical protein